MDNDKKPDKSEWHSIINAVRSPLSFLGLTVLVCNTAFGIAAAFIGIEAFKYAIHMFLAIVGTFVLIALWSPRSLYHPKDLKGMDDVLPDNKKAKVGVTIVLYLGMLIYMGYQLTKSLFLDIK